MRKAIAIALAASVAAPAMGQTKGPLPITTGIWIDANVQCGATDQAYLYDGPRWGLVFYYANPALGRGAQGDLKRILPVTRLRSGFTRIATEDDGEFSGLQIRAAGPDRAVLRTIGVYSKGVETSDDNLKRCGFGQLSPRMQAAVRQFAPSLATGGSQPSPMPSGRMPPAPVAPPRPVAGGAAVGPLGIAAGYYVDTAVACQRAYEAFYYDGTRVGVTAYDAGGNPKGLTLRPVGKPARRRDGSYFIASLATAVRPLPGGQIQLTVQDTGPPLRLCRGEDMPAKFRVR